MQQMRPVSAIQTRRAVPQVAPIAKGRGSTSLFNVAVFGTATRRERKAVQALVD